MGADTGSVETGHCYLTNGNESGGGAAGAHQLTHPGYVDRK